MKYLTTRDVIQINERLIQTYGGIPGVKNLSVLDSAVHRPQQTAFGEDLYPTLFLKAAALFNSIAMNHAFQDGNKRTAITSTGVFLLLNGYRMQTEDQMLEDFAVSAVAQKYSVETIAQWLERYSHPTTGSLSH